MDNELACWCLLYSYKTYWKLLKLSCKKKHETKIKKLE
jgi:hypothetical protein